MAGSSEYITVTEVRYSHLDDTIGFYIWVVGVYNTLMDTIISPADMPKKLI